MAEYEMDPKNRNRLQSPSRMKRYKSNLGTPKKNNIKKGGLIKKWMQSFTDDKGVFQGGMKKRLFGRAKDFAEQQFGGRKEFRETIGKDVDLDVSKKDQREFSEDIRESQTLNEKAGFDLYEANKRFNPDFETRYSTDKEGTQFEIPAYSEEFSYARDFALDFNPRDKNSVAELQRRLNNAGYVGADGKELAVDGQLGANSMYALRGMQGDMKYENNYAKNIISEQAKTNSRYNAIDNVQRWLKRDREELKAKLNIQKLQPRRAPEEMTPSNERVKLQPMEEEQADSLRVKQEEPLVPMPEEPLVPMPGTYGTKPIQENRRKRKNNPVDDTRNAIRRDQY